MVFKHQFKDMRNFPRQGKQSFGDEITSAKQVANPCEDEDSTLCSQWGETARWLVIIKTGILL